jgi:hypothetical protein
MQVVHFRRKDKMSDDLCIISAIKHAKVMSDCKKCAKFMKLTISCLQPSALKMMCTLKQAH